MAKLPDLVRAVSANTGFSEASVKILARSLREANWIQTGGRGRHGAEMGPADAASLLLGLASPGEWTHADNTVRKLALCHTVGVIIQRPQKIALYYPHDLRSKPEFLALPVHAALTQLVERYRRNDRSSPHLGPLDIPSFLHIEDVLGHEIRSQPYKTSHLELEAGFTVSSISLTVRFTDYYGTEAVLQFATNDGADVRMYFSSSHKILSPTIPGIGLCTIATIPGGFVDAIVRCIHSPFLR